MPRPPQPPQPFDTGPQGHWQPGQPAAEDETSPWAPAAPAGPQPPAGDPWGPGSDPTMARPVGPVGPVGPPGLEGEPPPAGERGDRRKRLLVAAVVLTVLVVAGLGAWLVLGSDDEAERRDGEIVTGGDLSAFSVREGDCWNDPPLDREVESVVAVPCGEAHDAEVYAVYDLELDEYPGDEEIGALAEAGCVERFTEFAGIDYATSELEIVYLNPTQESWDDKDDRTAVCSVSDPAGPTTGSLRGAAQ